MKTFQNPPRCLDVIPNILDQYFSIADATNSSGVCSQLLKIMKSTLVISGTEDVSVPAANSLILAEKIPDLGLFRLKEVDMGYVPVFGTVQQDCENISRKPRTHVGRGYIKAVPQGINKDNNN